MIKWTEGDILSVTEGIIAHGCNCSGGFGSGIAGQIAKKYPSAQNHYFQEYDDGWTLLGDYSLIQVSPTLSIANLYTQQYFGGAGTKWACPRAILKSLGNVLYYNNDVHVPLIGCGLGGLDWETEVKPIYEFLGKYYDFTVWSYK